MPDRLLEQPSETKRLFRFRIWAAIPWLALYMSGRGKDMAARSTGRQILLKQDSRASAPRDGLSNCAFAGNILPNSQWQVITTFGNGNKRNAAGTGTMPPIRVSGYTVGSNRVTCKTDNTGELKVGDLVVFSSQADTNMRICSMRVDALAPNVSFTGALPLGLAPTVSAACTAQPTMAGGMPSVGTVDGPDGWSKSTTLQVWRDDHAVNSQPGSRYQLGMLKGSSAPEMFGHYIPIADLDRYRGRPLVAAIWMYQKVKQGQGTWSIFIETDGTNGGRTSSQRDSLRSYEWRETTKQIPPDCSYILIGVELAGAAGDLYYMSQPICDYGTRLGRGNYRAPVGERLIPKVKLSPLSYIGADIKPGSQINSAGDYGFALRPYPETNGAIAPTVKTLSMQIEARCDIPNQTLGIRNQQRTPHIYGLLIYCKVATMMETYHGELTLDQNGDAYVYSGEADAHWYNASIDINGYRLS